MQSALRRIRDIDWITFRRNGHNLFSKLIRTRTPSDGESSEDMITGRQRLTRCLTTTDLTSLGVGSCVGTGMYLVAGMVARRLAGPAAILSFFIAAMASILSGTCYAEFGVRIPNTTGSAYTYSYVSVGEFLAFIIGWNLILEYMIGSSACARALSACLDSLFNGAISEMMAANFGTVFGKPPDFVAFGITIVMTMVMIAGVKKSLFLNNVLNAINLTVWVFIMGAGLFYVKGSNWTEHNGFLPYGWSGVFSGAATCFYAFIGFDIIATTGEEAHNPKRSIPLAIVMSLGIILLAYVSSSIILTLIVPYDEVVADAALVQMFSYVHAPICMYIVAIGALAGLTVSMFGSMFPLPRIIYAMASDGLIFKKMGNISELTGTPALATVAGGCCAAVMSLFIQLDVLVAIMSIGTLLAYTLVSTCVLVLRYQPHTTNLIELLPQSLRHPCEPEGSTAISQDTIAGSMAPSDQRVMIRRVTRSSPDSDDSLPGDESEEFGRDDTFLVNINTENSYYGTVPAGCSGSYYSRFVSSISRRLHVMSYLCPGFFPWVDPGPATESSGLFVIKAVGVMYVLIILMDMIAAYGNPGPSTFTNVTLILLALGILIILILISRKPQNRASLIYTAPCLPFVPTIAIIVNIYLILNLSILTLVRFLIWMIFGLIMYFKYGIKNSTLETDPAPTPMVELPSPNQTEIAIIPSPRPTGDRNIFEGDGNSGMFGNNDQFSNPLLVWHETELVPVQSIGSSQRASSNNTSYKQVESRFNERTNRTTSHTSSRPPWAYPDAPYESWDI